MVKKPLPASSRAAAGGTAPASAKAATSAPAESTTTAISAAAPTATRVDNRARPGIGRSHPDDDENNNEENDHPGWDALVVAFLIGNRCAGPGVLALRRRDHRVDAR